MKINHLYIHIPFCKYICSYCDFCKKYQKYYDKDHYLDLLDQELSLYPYLDQIKTIYIGGGTPSVLNGCQLEKLRTILEKHLDLNKVVEFSFEMNPDDIDHEYMKQLQILGVNRLSIGVQTMNDTILKILGREYTSSDVEHALGIANRYFDNISIDLMFNLPLQKLNDLTQCFTLLKQYKNIKHVSCYSLIVEPHTKLGNINYSYLPEDVESEWYTYLQKELANLGFEQYEISNWAISQEYESKHNLAYWYNQPYLAIGLSGSSYVDNYRFSNTCSYHEYEQLLNQHQVPVSEYEVLTHHDIVSDYLMLALRTRYGVSEKWMEKLDYDQTFFATINTRVVIKPEYYFISNELILKLLMKLEEIWQKSEF